MRTPVLALLLCLPLAAGETGFGKAIELWRDGNAPARERGTEIADREARRLLAPLLAAMQDPDPEVRRRARSTILGLVPGAPAPEEPEVGDTRRRMRIQLQAQAAINRLLAQRADAARTGRAQLARLGLVGRTRRQAPFMPGYLVLEVKRGSVAGRLGLRPGDLIVRMNRKPVSTDLHFAHALPVPKLWEKLRFEVHRGQNVVFLPLKPPDPAGR